MWRRRRWWLAAAAVAVATAGGRGDDDDSMAALLARVRGYCNNPPAPAGAEGTPPASAAQPILLQSHVILRHGDRSAIHGLPGAPTPRWPCGAPGAHDVAWASEHLAPLLSSPRCMVWGQGCNATVTSDVAALPARVRVALAAWSSARHAEDACSDLGGELSSIGWQQGVAIGAALAALPAYERLLTTSANPLMIASTDTGRTVLTATAVVSGLLTTLPVLPPAAAFPLPLHIVPRARDPMMWPKVYGGCTAVAAEDGTWVEGLEHAMRPPTPVARAIAELAGMGSEGVPGTEAIADAIYARMCHGHGLPCWNDDDCLSPATALHLLQHGDGLYASRYRNVASLALLFPFFHQVRTQMARAIRQHASADASGDGDGAWDMGAGVPPTPPPPPAPGVVVRAAHDTVIAPMLTALGMADRPAAWPGYASRVVLELWALGAGAGNTASRAQHWVQVVANGEKVEGATMPWDAWVRWVDTLLSLPSGEGAANGTAWAGITAAGADAWQVEADMEAQALAAWASRCGWEPHPPTLAQGRGWERDSDMGGHHDPDPVHV